MIGRDQHGNTWSVDRKRPKASLLDAMGARSANRMFIDRAGKTFHVGYVVSGGHGCAASWVTFYDVVEAVVS